MKEKWLTRAHDMFVAEQIMDEYARKQDNGSLGIFEIFVNQGEKQMNFRLSNWVLTLAEHFKSVYGENQGEFVVRKVISRCLTNGQTLH